MTIADLTIQKSVEYILKALYPKINIIGEEDPEEYKNLDPLVEMPEDISEMKSIVSDELLTSHMEERKAAISESMLIGFVLIYNS